MAADLERPRNTRFERMVTRMAASIKVDSLNRMAEARADKFGPLRPKPCRDLRREVMEELADARNYLVWWIQEETNDEARMRAATALRGVCEAWEALQ